MSLSHAKIHQFSKTPRGPPPEMLSGQMTPRINELLTPRSNQLPSIFQKSAVTLEESEVNESFIKPKVKFDTIFDEYIDK